MLARTLERIASGNRRWRDFTLASLTHALSETIAAFPVYRTYLREAEAARAQDVQQVQHAVRTARRRSSRSSPAVFAFIEDVLLLRVEGTDEEQRAHARVRAALPAAHRPGDGEVGGGHRVLSLRRFVALNEVGGMPASSARRSPSFHAPTPTARAPGLSP